MNNINIGIMGCGWIATVMASTINKMEGITLYAAASRSLDKAKEFSNEYNCKKYYGSYEELVKDSNVDLVYIATPHSHHYENALLCLNNNKHVLCEKAFMVNSKLAKDIFKLAKERNLLVAEAMWSRYTPLAKKLKQLVLDGKIGLIKTIKSELHYPISHVERLYNPELAGGVLLDLGIYTIAFTKLIQQSKIKEITSLVDKFDTGVDRQTIINIKFEDNSIATLSCGCESISSRENFILGTEGYIKVINNNNFEKIEVFNNNGEKIEEYLQEPQITGFEYEVLECINSIKNKKIEVESMTHRDSLDMLYICDEVRKQNNIKYPFE